MLREPKDADRGSSGSFSRPSISKRNTSEKEKAPHSKTRFPPSLIRVARPAHRECFAARQAQHPNLHTVHITILRNDHSQDGRF